MKEKTPFLADFAVGCISHFEDELNIVAQVSYIV